MEEPLTLSGPIGYICHVVEGTEIGISEDLSKEIFDWNTEYQNTFDPNDPLNSGFLRQEQAEEHDAVGVRLRDKIERQVGDRYNTVYVSNLKA